MSKEISALEMKQLSTPADPGAGFTKLYFKSDAKPYLKTAAGVEKPLTPVTVGTTAPTSPATGDLWVDTN